MISDAILKNPFPGLRPFDEPDAYLFFGREAQVSKLLGRLRTQRFVAVVGTSGSGKSSLVRAGLQAALHRGSMSGAGSRWRIAVMRPESTPITNLARALDTVGLPGYAEGRTNAGDGLTRAILDRGSLGLVDVVAQATDQAGTRVLIIVDQFEELFRFADESRERNADEAAAFVKLLIVASESKASEIYVLLTMRSDYIGSCAQYRGLAEKINDGLFLIPRMTRDQLAQAIDGPVEVSGAKISPVLVNRLINDVGDDPDQLPVLQHVLMRSWDEWKRNLQPGESINDKNYEDTGGVENALSTHADEVLATLSPSRQEIAERLFKALTRRIGEQDPVRRPIAFATACAVVGAPPGELMVVVDAFRAPGCTFLMPPSNERIKDDTKLDISHESLIRIWKKLRAWVDDEAHSAEIYERLARAARSNERREAGLLREPELSAAAAWRDGKQPNEAWGATYGAGYDRAIRFLDRSIRARGVRRIAAVTGGTVLALALAITALVQYRSAGRAHQVAIASHMADVAAQRLSSDPIAMLLATEAFDAAPNATTAAAMLQSVRSFPVLRRIRVPEWTISALSDHGRAIAIVANFPARGSIAAHSDLLVLDADSFGVRSRAPDVRATAICGFTGAPRVAMLDRRTVSLLDVGSPRGSVLAHRSFADPAGLACLPGSSRVAVALDGRAIAVVDLETGASVGLGRVPDPVDSITISPRGTAVAVVHGAGKYIDVLAVPAAATDTGDARHPRDALSNGSHRLARISVERSPTCPPQVVFSADEARLAWNGSAAVYTSSVDGGHVRRFPARREFSGRAELPRCEEVAIAYEADGVLTTLGGAALNVRNSDGSIIATSADFSRTRSFGLRQMLDRELGVLITDGGGLSMLSLPTMFRTTLMQRRSTSYRSNIDLPPMSMPALGLQPGQPFSGSFALSGTALILETDVGPRPYVLDRYLSAVAEGRAPLSRTVRIRDSGDGAHAVSFDYESGIVSVLDLGTPPSISSSFRITPLKNVDGEWQNEPQVAYDPSTKAVTVANAQGFKRFSSTGQVLKEWATWSALESQARVTPDQLNTHDLSPTGRYVLIFSAQTSDYLVTIEGKKLGEFGILASISRDEKYVFAADLRPSAPLNVYEVMTQDEKTRRISGLALRSGSQARARVAGISRDGKMIAYMNSLSSSYPQSLSLSRFSTSPTALVTLFDVPTRTQLGDLNPPPDLRSVNELAFSADNRYLVVDYGSFGGRRLAVYAVDPRSWQRSLCLIAGTDEHERILQEEATRGVFGEYVYTNACTRYGLEDVLRDPPPSPPPGPTKKTAPTAAPG